MNIETLHLQNFRCFENSTFHFAPSFNLIIGENASGKTNLLRSLIIAAGSLFLNMPETDTPRIEKKDIRFTLKEINGKLDKAPQATAKVETTGTVLEKQGAWTRSYSGKKRKLT